MKRSIEMLWNKVTFKLLTSKRETQFKRANRTKVIHKSDYFEQNWPIRSQNKQTESRLFIFSVGLKRSLCDELRFVHEN